MKNITVIEARDLVAGESLRNEEERYVAALSERMKAFCNPVRLKILQILAGVREHVLAITRLIEIVGIHESCVSRHVKALVRAGLVRLIEEEGKRGKPHHVMINHEAVQAVLREVLQFTGIAGV